VLPRTAFWFLPLSWAQAPFKADWLALQHDNFFALRSMNLNLLISNLTRNFAALGARRLIMLAASALALMGIVFAAAHYASRPEFTSLYANLDRQDVTAIGDALAREGIAFDVSADGAIVMVPPKDVARSRTMLAEKGLPRSMSAGYELFDHIGSLGLTSFMQEVTLVRALEGEIGRTIQTIRGVSAARVHLVLPDHRGLARDREKPTASVVIRTEGLTPSETARSIRHLVAAAVPGLTVDAVTVMDTEGTLLAGDGEGSAPSANALFGLERTVSATIEQNIRRALQPLVGADNFRISVAARLNSDRREISETVFDPDGRVERSTKVTKATEASKNSDSSSPSTVTEELPEDQVGASAAASNSENTERREEVTDYALSSRTTATISDGYKIEGLSIAVIINTASIGEAAKDPAKLAARLEELRGLITTASGVDTERGDKVALSALEFAVLPDAAAETAGFNASSFLSANTGTFIRSAAFVAVALLVLLMGVRPAMRAMSAPPETLTASGSSAQLSAPATEDPAADVAAKLDDTSRKRLERIIELDEEKAVAVLKQWLRSA
jgi:flagellar M-ring protein FliF